MAFPRFVGDKFSLIMLNYINFPGAITKLSRVEIPSLFGSFVFGTAMISQRQTNCI
jgi:hypothetical protein